MESCTLSSYVFANGLQTTNLRTNQEQFSLKDWDTLRTANVSLNFTGSYTRECILKLILDVKAETMAENQRVMLKSLFMPFFIIKRSSLGWGYGLVCYKLLQEAVSRRLLVM